MNNPLQLPHWTVMKVSDEQGEQLIEASYDVAAVCCTHCGGTEKLHKHGTKTQRLHDIPAYGKRVIIDVKRLRYWCKDCGKTFLQPLPDMAESGSMTKRLREYIERNSLKHTFAHVAEEVGLDEKTIRNVFNEYVDYLDKTVTFETPEVLGLDEVYLLGTPRCVAVNVVLATIVGVLEDRNKPTLHEYLFWLKDKEKVQVVTMDMWKPYKDAVRAVLPGAKVVVDKFHIVRMATNALEDVRRKLRDDMTATKRREVMRSRFLALKRNRDLNDEEREKLAEWTTTLPRLGAAYRLKESYYDIFDIRDRAEAVKAYDAWEKSIPDDMRGAFKALTTAMTNWREEIFDIIEYGVSNAVVEALNGVTKIANRNGRGYSFKAIRAKMLYNRHIQQTTIKMNRFDGVIALLKPPSKRRVPDAADIFTREEAEGVKTYGTHLDLLGDVLVAETVHDYQPPKTTPPSKRRRSRL